MEPGKTIASVCPSCGGELKFDPTIGKLKCSYCDSVFLPREINALWKEREKDSENTDSQLELTPENGILLYGCSTCGAQLMADRNTAVMKCPFCGNQTLFLSQFSGALRPEFIIPFKYTKRQAEEKYMEFYAKRFLLPGSFKKTSHVQEIQGVYVPFFLFDGRIHVSGEYLADDTSDNNNKLKLDLLTFHLERQGYLDYKNIPTDASRRMDDELMDSIEPYHLNDMRKFSLSYLPGFLAERYDVSEEECRARAHGRVETSVKYQVNKTIKHSTIQMRNETFTYSEEKAHYAFLPVWLLVTKWKNRICKFVMNGQTGKMVGDLPVSLWKMLAVLILVFLGIYLPSLIISAALKLDMTAAMISSLILPAFVVVFVGILMYTGMKSVRKAEDADSFIKRRRLVLTMENENVVTVVGARQAMKRAKAAKKAKRR